MTVLVAVTFSAQQLLTISSVSPGVYTMTYNDSANSWAFYDPFSQPIGVYMWIEAADSSANASFGDAWTNITTTLTWDGTNYSGTIDLNTHNFNQTGGVLPAGTTVNQIHFLFTESPSGNGSHQTTDKLGTNYGFTSSTTVTTPLSVSDLSAFKGKSVVAGGKLITHQKGNLEVTVYDFGGKVVRTMSVKADGNAIDLYVPQTGLYLAKITNGTETEVVKFVK